MTIFEEYAILDAQIVALTSQKEKMRPCIIKEIIEMGETKIETSLGNFSVVPHKSWKYSPKVTNLGELFKAEKAKEESTGIATCEISDTLRFNSIKI